MRGWIVFALMLVAVTAAADTVLLRDGTTLYGKIVEENSEYVVITVMERTMHRWTETGRREIPRAEIRQVTYEPLSLTAYEGWMPRDPDYNSVLLCPTPATLEKGDSYFRNFEIYFVNFGWAPTSSTNVSVMTHFPIASFMDFGALGLKQRLLDREEHGFGAALAGSYLFFPKDDDNRGLLTASLILGVGDWERSLNLSLNQSYAEDEDPYTSVMLGGDIRVGSRAKMLLEYLNTAEGLDDDFHGMLNFGFRLFGDRWSFSLTGLRPMREADDLFAVPLIQFSYHF